MLGGLTVAPELGQGFRSMPLPCFPCTQCCWTWACACFASCYEFLCGGFKQRNKSQWIHSRHSCNAEMNHVGLLLFSPPFESFSIEMKRTGVVAFGWEGATSHVKALPRDLCFQEDLHFLITCDELTKGLAARPFVALGYHSFVLELASLIANPLWVTGLFPLVCSTSALHLHWRVCEYCDLFYFNLSVWYSKVMFPCAPDLTFT